MRNPKQSDSETQRGRGVAWGGRGEGREGAADRVKSRVGRELWKPAGGHCCAHGQHHCRCTEARDDSRFHGRCSSMVGETCKPKEATRRDRMHRTECAWQQEADSGLTTWLGWGFALMPWETLPSFKHTNDKT